MPAPYRHFRHVFPLSCSFSLLLSGCGSTGGGDTPTPTPLSGPLAPSISSAAPATAVRGLPFSYHIVATDPDGSAPLTYALSHAPTGMTVSAAGVITWTPPVGMTTLGPVTVTVVDAGGATTIQSFSLSIDNADPRILVANVDGFISGPAVQGQSATLPFRVTEVNGPDSLSVTWSADSTTLDHTAEAPTEWSAGNWQTIIPVPSGATYLSLRVTGTDSGTALDSGLLTWPVTASDGTPPTLTVTLEAPTITMGQTLQATITASEPINGLASDDLVVQGGVLNGSLHQISATTYTADLVAGGVAGDLTLTLAAGTCTDGSGNATTTTTSATATVIVPTAPAPLITTSADLTLRDVSPTWEFSFTDRDPTTAEPLAVGGVLASDEGVGYLRKITGVTTAGTTISVTTDAVSLREVVGEATVNETFKLSQTEELVLVAPRQARVRLLSRPTLAPRSRAAKDLWEGLDILPENPAPTRKKSRDITGHLNGVSFEQNIDFPSATNRKLGIGVAGSITYDPDIIFAPKWTWSDGFQGMHVAVAGTLAVDFTATIGMHGEATYARSRQLPFLPPSRKVFAIGPVPVVVTIDPDLELRWSATASGEATFTSHFQRTATMRLDMNMDSHGAITAGGSNNPGGEPITPTLQGTCTAEVQVGIVPQFKLGLYEIGGLMMEGEIATRLKATAGSTLGATTANRSYCAGSLDLLFNGTAGIIYGPECVSDADVGIVKDLDPEIPDEDQKKASSGLIGVLDRFITTVLAGGALTPKEPIIHAEKQLYGFNFKNYDPKPDITLVGATTTPHLLRQGQEARFSIGLDSFIDPVTHENDLQHPRIAWSRTIADNGDLGPAAASSMTMIDDPSTENGTTWIGIGTPNAPGTWYLQAYAAESYYSSVQYPSEILAVTVLEPQLTPLFRDQGNPTIAALGHRTLTLNFNNPVSDFTVDDLVVAHGAVTAVSSVGTEQQVWEVHLVQQLTDEDSIPAAPILTLVAGSCHDGLGAGNLEVTYTFTLSANQAPSLSSIGDMTIATGSTVGPLSFTVEDADSPLGSVIITATSSDPAVVPLDAIVLGGQDAERTVTITAGTSGVSLITLTASDGELTSQMNFEVTVTGSTVAGNFADDFAGATIDSTKWTTGGSTAVVADGALSLRMDVTDAGGWARSVALGDGNLSALRVTVRHYMAPGGAYFFPQLSMTSTDESHSLDFQWLRSDWAPDYQNDSANYDHPKLNLSGGVSIFDRSTTSSSLYGQWITSVIDYDATTGVYRVDHTNDGAWDLSVVIPEADRIHIHHLYLGGFGWWTSHRHDFDNISVTWDTTPAPWSPAGTSWSVAPVENGVVYSYDPTPWIFEASGVLHAGNLWSGTWAAAVGLSSECMLTSDPTPYGWTTVFSADHTSFSAYRNGVEFRRGQRINP